MNDNDRVIKLAREKGLDVAVWPTGGGMENVHLILERGKDGKPTAWLVGSDCDTNEGFSFSGLLINGLTGDKYYNIWDEGYWVGNAFGSPSTDDPQRVVEYISEVALLFKGWLRPSIGWVKRIGWVYDEEED